jgi:hypothetical protein
MDFVLAQFNITRLKAPLDAPETKEFADFLAPVNRFAEESPGFIWRLVGPDGESSSYLAPIYDDPMVVTNLSVWQDIDSLKNFVYQSVHVYFLRNRKKWLEQASSTPMVLWWVPRGHFPTAQEGKEKLRQLEELGPGPGAFTFQVSFDSEGNLLKP